ncbi:MAG: SufS family cysteine desulfurase [Planctomycetes bacterium]|nr:SufS family cysteine desulfurase [Planctomycetota bacterium]
MNPTVTHPDTSFDVPRVRADFPILATKVHGKPLVYLDNAATSQKPQCVIDAIDDYYRSTNANIHRGVHYLAEKATEAYEGARAKMARFLGADHAHEIIFTRGTTESINLVAQSFGRSTLKPGDEVLITWLEHHSNIVPWQMVCEQTGATLMVVPINDRGELDMNAFESLLTERTKIVAVNHISNALGTINPIKRIIDRAHQAGAVVLIDGAQAAPHLKIDVRALGCDFYALSGHKMYGPTGIGILWGREALLEKMPPYQGGGDMIASVTFQKTVYNNLPYKFEAGTPHICGGIALGVAADYLAAIDYTAMNAHEHALTEYGTQQLSQIEGLRLIGTAAEKVSVLSFTLEGIHPYDMAPVLDREGVAVRTGHHCAQPVMDRFHIPATVRASVAMYNTREDIDALIAALAKVRRMFAGL